MRRKFSGMQGMLTLLMVLFVSGCGTEIAYTWKLMPKDSGALTNYREIVVDVREKDGVSLSRQVRERLTRRIGESISTGCAGKYTPVSVDKAGPRTLYTQIFITRYDDGRDFAVSVFQIPERMHIDGDVILSDWQTREKLVEFEMLQTYDRNNSIGRFPRIDELEPEFAQKVVAGIAQLAL